MWFFKKAAPDRGVDFLRALLGYEKVVVECEDLASLRKAAGARFAYYNDLVIVFTARRLGLRLATFDKRMAGRAGAFGVPVLRSRGG
ncbi:hypothetical protein ODS41_07605 [Pyrobaculum sp. 3827-6]|uniref:hypothetical protein n=1 Tax=Pyrobaculum sp. 3827-6 TaxID=2983604 RepID=UPI0021D9CE1C|nr:hypothetical protein [Pyrobaculum sp. 3827-6]MCU7787777.1 hypothetical protein [Pyrobaculum sp. 3827-6]